MKRLFIAVLLMFLMAATAAADLTREQCAERLDQALQVWRQGGKIWKARVELLGDTENANFYVQYPGKFLVDYDRGNDLYWDGSKLWTYLQGSDKQENSDSGPETVFWILSDGAIGKNVAVDMLDQETVNYFGEELRVVAADLVVSGERLPRTRMRLYLRGEGPPEILGFDGHGVRFWLRDFHQLSPQKDPFNRSIL